MMTTIRPGTNTLKRSPADVDRDHVTAGICSGDTAGIDALRSTLSTALQSAQSIEQRMSALSDRMLGGIPRAAGKPDLCPTANGGAMGELEQALYQLQNTLVSANESLERLERFGG